MLQIVRSRVRLSVLLLLSATGVTLWFVSADLFVWTKSSGGSVVSVTPLNVGEVWAQADFKWPVRFANQTDDEIEIVEIGKSCRCAALEPPSFTISPRATVEVTLIVDLRPCRPAKSIGEIRPFSLWISPLIKRGNKTERREFMLQARARIPLAVSDEEIFFREHDQETTGGRFSPKVLRFESAVPLKAVEAWAEPPCVSTAASLETEYSGVVTLTPNTDLPLGPFESQVHLSAIPVAEKFFPSVTVPVSGVVLDDVEVVPPLILLRPTPVGRELQTTVVLRSRSGTPFSLSSAQANCEETSVEALGGDLAEGHQYRIRQRITDTGSQSSAVDFLISSERDGSRRIRTRLNYVGLPREASP